MARLDRLAWLVVVGDALVFAVCHLVSLIAPGQQEIQKREHLV
jgi:hypothetical protein